MADYNRYTPGRRVRLARRVNGSWTAGYFDECKGATAVLRPRLTGDADGELVRMEWDDPAVDRKIGVFGGANYQAFALINDDLLDLSRTVVTRGAFPVCNVVQDGDTVRARVSLPQGEFDFTYNATGNLIPEYELPVDLVNQ